MPEMPSFHPKAGSGWSKHLFLPSLPNSNIPRSSPAQKINAGDYPLLPVLANAIISGMDGKAIWRRLFWTWILAGCLPCWSLDAADAGLNQALDLAGPERISGVIYESGSHRQVILYRFLRTAKRSGSEIRVQRQFWTPQGRLAARGDVLYESNCLVFCRMQEFQAQVSGMVTVQPDKTHVGRDVLRIGYAKGLTPPVGEPQVLKPDTLIDDDVYPFLLEHWVDLMQGASVRFRFISLEWTKTFNFQLVKSGMATVDGRNCARITMKPVGFFLQQVVKPLVFIVDTAPPHAILSYTGRTMPRIWANGSWKYLDAETVFDLGHMVAAKP